MARDRYEREDDEEDDRPRQRKREENDDEYEDRRPPQTSSPGGAKAAGIIWTITGGLAAILALLGVLGMAAGPQGGPPAQFVCGVVFWGFIALIFLMVGIKTVTGSSAEPLANGIGSIIFGLIIAGLGVFIVVGGVGLAAQLGPIGAYIAVIGGGFVLFGATLLLAGILIIVARENYNRFRKYKKAQRRAAEDRGRRRDPRDDDEEEEDDRPRRRRPRDDDEE